MPEDELFVVNWHTDQFALDPSKTYRVRILAGEVELGHADVDVAANGAELKNVETGEYIVLKDGRTLPIKFRIEEGVRGAAVVGKNGGAITFEGGAVVLVLPMDALARDTLITVERVQDVTSLPQPIEGPVFDFGPDGIVFDTPVTLTIGYDPSELPPGVSEASLSIYMLHSDHPFWDPVDESVVDLSNHKVSGAIDGFTLGTLFNGAAKPAVLTHELSHGSGLLQSSAQMGVWMFKPDKLDLDAIADWLARGTLRCVPGVTCLRHEHWDDKGVIIHEPINVLWIDYASKNPADAQAQVELYLRAAGFFQEPATNEFGVPQHGAGYFGFANGDFIPQSGVNADVTWVDAAWPAENNHGRIFPAANVGTTERLVFYTLGAFSREGDAFVTSIQPHRFLSFDRAQNWVLDFQPPGEAVHGWKYEKLDAGWGNILELTTADHEGVAILVRGGKLIVEVSVTGQNLDDALTVLVDAGTTNEAKFAVSPNATHDLGGFPAGTHRIELTDVASNCTVPIAQEVELANSEVEQVGFELLCVASALAIGTRVEAQAPAAVRAGPLSGGQLGSQPVGSLGVIADGPLTTDLQWWLVDWDTGPDGWVHSGLLSATPEPAPVASPSLSVRYHVQNLLLSNVRESPSASSTVLGMEPPTNSSVPSLGREDGTIVDGPVIAHGLAWWRIDWVSGLVGWVPETGLRRTIGVGDRVETSPSRLNIRALPNASATFLGTTMVGSRGTVLEGPEFGSGFEWWRINFDIEADGWVVGILGSPLVQFAHGPFIRVFYPADSPHPEFVPRLHRIDLRVGGVPSCDGPDILTARLGAQVTDVDGNVMPAANVMWRSLNTAVATVDGGGLVTAVSAGTTEIVSSFEDVSFSVIVAVTQPAPPIFNSGDRVITTARSNVRAAPGVSAEFVGSQDLGVAGRVLEGPVCADGHRWWNVDWDTGPDGWTVQIAVAHHP